MNSTFSTSGKSTKRQKSSTGHRWLTFLLITARGTSTPTWSTRPKNASTNQNNKEVAGKSGKGIQFSGDDTMSFPKEFGNFNRHQTFSMAFWIKPAEFLERAVVVKRSQAWTDAGSRGYEILIEDGRLSPALIHFGRAMPFGYNPKSNFPSMHGPMWHSPMTAPAGLMACSFTRMVGSPRWKQSVTTSRGKSPGEVPPFSPLLSECGTGDLKTE